ncbi:2OG-Fe(II) oxygenase superfamily [Musa troglodytarum]|uniref:2OG-Fe(II) oxygenase superfamily n=1 Tax=Musa troglodytarum TaxID=320322 RepID=A0A9E7JHK5_9LILI|nr:2OG-Fe(II) oxygenase superfamily [Musa troglodytarum]
MSNGKYKRLVHRAVLNTQKRISIATELVDEQHPKGYIDSSFLDFLDFITSTNKTGGRNFIDSLKLTGN